MILWIVGNKVYFSWYPEVFVRDEIDFVFDIGYFTPQHYLFVNWIIIALDTRLSPYLHHIFDYLNTDS